MNAEHSKQSREVDRPLFVPGYARRYPTQHKTHMTEPGRLQVTMQFDDDGTTNLVATASAHGFAGRGSAWFNVSDVRNFAYDIARYPLDNEVALAGGYYSKTTPGELIETHLSIRAYLINGRGQLGLRLLMFEPQLSRPHSNSDHSVELEIRTVYNRLERFSIDLIAILDGKIGEAVLEEELL